MIFHVLACYLWFAGDDLRIPSDTSKYLGLLMLCTTLCGKRPCYIDIKSKPICDSIRFNLNVFHSSKAKEIFKICAKKRKDRFTVI